MSLPAFEGACLLIIFLTLWALSRLHPVRGLLLDYLALALGAWLGEQSCIALYGFYHYAAGWHCRLGDVPLLVPLIWPLVILSGRDVVRALWPHLFAAGGRQALWAALAIGLLVALDASLVEVLAVRAGLWSWAEPGYLGVPLIGILGWGYFAAASSWLLFQRTAGRRLLVPLLAPLLTQVAIQASWWGLFRFALRGEIGEGRALVGLGGVELCALLLVVERRRQGRAVDLSTALPRMVAASLFLLLLLRTAPTAAPLWLHAAVVAIPYCLLTRWSPATGRY